jgi:hypothetical protein
MDKWLKKTEKYGENQRELSIRADITRFLLKMPGGCAHLNQIRLFLKEVESTSQHIAIKRALEQLVDLGAVDTIRPKSFVINDHWVKSEE